MRIPTRELTFVHRRVRFTVVDTANAWIAVLPERFMVEDPAPDDASTAEVRYVIEPWRPPRRGAEAGYRVVRDGTLRYLGRCTDRLAQWLYTDIDAHAARLSGTRLLLRAAAVVWRDRAVAIAGRAGTGTSRLAAALIDHGATGLSDDLVVIDHQGRIQAYPRPLARPATPLALVVSATYQPRWPWEPRVLRGARAVLPILENALAENDEAAHALRVAAQLAPRLVTLQGPRGDAASAVPRILAALDELLDHPGAPAAVTAQERRIVSRATEILATQRSEVGAG